MPDRNRMTKTSAVFRKLSLNAAKNWHQNRGANRLDSNRGSGMPPHYCKVPRRSRRHGTKKSGLAAAKANTTALSSRASIFLVGFHRHRPKSEADRYTYDNHEQRGPHGAPPLPSTRTVARGSPAKETRKDRFGSGSIALKSRTGEKTANRAAICANRAHGTPDKYGVTSAATPNLPRPGCAAYRPCSKPRMRKAGSRYICAAPAPAPACAPWSGLRPPADICRDVARVRILRCAPEQRWPQRSGFAEPGTPRPTFDPASP